MVHGYTARGQATHKWISSCSRLRSCPDHSSPSAKASNRKKKILRRLRDILSSWKERVRARACDTPRKILLFSTTNISVMSWARARSQDVTTISQHYWRASPVPSASALGLRTGAAASTIPSLTMEVVGMETVNRQAWKNQRHMSELRISLI